MPDGPPSRALLGRDALERVLARAAELQSRTGDDEGTTVSEARLIEIAREVGLSPDSVRQAIAEENARVNLEPETGMPFATLGTAYVQASRAVAGDAASVLQTLDTWMQRTESLQVKRRFPGELAWEARQDFLSNIRRALRVGGRGFHIASAVEVRGVVTSVDGRRSHVALVADFHASRGQRAAAALGVAAGGVLIGVPVFALAMSNGLALAAGLALVPALVVPAVAISIARSGYRSLLNRATVALEQALDRLEYGEAPRRGF